MTVFFLLCIFDLLYSCFFIGGGGSINSGHRGKKEHLDVLVTKVLFFFSLPYSYEAYAYFHTLSDFLLNQVG